MIQREYTDQERELVRSTPEVVQRLLIDNNFNVFYAAALQGYEMRDFIKQFMLSDVAALMDFHLNYYRWQGSESILPDFLDECSLAEIELITAVITFLKKLDFQNFKIRINDRRILLKMIEYVGLPLEKVDSILIILDKMDKIGLDGVAEELKKAGFEESSIQTYLKMFEELKSQENGIAYIGEKLKDVLEGDAANNLQQIVSAVEQTTKSSFRLSFDPTLVRGMSYYTGTIFEIEMEGFPGSVAGGGRYDEMVGKFTNMQTPACGFSIGFERIVTILLENGFEVPGTKKKKAYLIEKGVSADRMGQALAKAMQERANGEQVLVTQMNKNKKFQKEQLMAEGYTEFEEFYKKEFLR